MYYPSRDLYYDPSKFGLQPEDVWTESEKKDKIHGWWFEAKNSKGTIVFFHGNAENLTSHYMQIVWIVEYGYNLLVFDYPGYGLSSGEPDPESCVYSAYSMIDWVQKNKNPHNQPLIIYGQSMGGAIALRAALDRKEQVPLHAVVADSAFNTFQGIGRKKLSSYWLTWLIQPLAYVLLSDKWAAKDLENLSPIPTLVIHGQKDPVVEPEFGEKIYSELRDPKEIWRIEDGVHIDVFWRHDKLYRQKFLDWLAQLKH